MFTPTHLIDDANNMNVTKDDFVNQLRHDSDLIRDELLAFMRAFIVHKLSKHTHDDKQQFFTIFFWDLHRNSALETPAFRTRMKTRIKPSTFFTGMWVPEIKKHDTSAWRQADRGLMIDELSKRMAPCKLVDVSDPTKSVHRVTEFKMPLFETKGGES